MCSITSVSGWIGQDLYLCAIRQYIAPTKASGCAHLDPSELLSKRKWDSPGFPDVPALNEKGFVSSHIKPQITKPRGSRKSLFTNSFLSTYEKPSPQAGDLRQGTEWVYAPWDDFWRLSSADQWGKWLLELCLALLMLCTSLYSGLERALMFPLHCESSPLKIIIDLTSLLSFRYWIYWRQLQLEI